MRLGYLITGVDQVTVTGSRYRLRYFVISFPSKHSSDQFVSKWRLRSVVVPATSDLPMKKCKRLSIRSGSTFDNFSFSLCDMLS